MDPMPHSALLCSVADLMLSFAIAIQAIHHSYLQQPQRPHTRSNQIQQQT